MSSAVRDPLEGDIPYVEGEQIEEDEEEEDEDVPIGAYEDEIYGKSSSCTLIRHPLQPANTLN